MKKLTSIDRFIEGAQVQGFYICVEKYIRYTKSGDLYIDLELRVYDRKYQCKNLG